MDKIRVQLSDKEIAKKMGITVTKLRARRLEFKEYSNEQLYTKAKKLKEEGLSNIEISMIMELKESKVRLLLNVPSI